MTSWCRNYRSAACRYPCSASTSQRLSWKRSLIARKTGHDTGCVSSQHKAANAACSDGCRTDSAEMAANCHCRAADNYRDTAISGKVRIQARGQHSSAAQTRGHKQISIPRYETGSELLCARRQTENHYRFLAELSQQREAEGQRRELCISRLDQPREGCKRQ